MTEFAYELDSIEKVRICRDALSSCPPDKFDLELCKELTAVLDNPARHNCLAQPRLMSWIKKSFK
tara:strand:+ start:205 stop:399 length:195 start_codon:yes stop_codon:yes gene_type:complete